MSRTFDADILITDIDFYSLSLVCDLIQDSHIVSGALEPPGSKTLIKLCVWRRIKTTFVFL